MSPGLRWRVGAHALRLSAAILGHLSSHLAKLGLGLLFAVISALLSSPDHHAAADSALRFQAGSNHARTALTDRPGLTLGGSLALTRWQPLDRVALIPQIEFLFARRPLGFAALGDSDNNGSDDRAPALDTGRYALDAADTIDVPLLLRAELSLAGRSFYALGGIYGSVLLRAQQVSDGDVAQVNLAHSVDIAQRLDVGLVAGAGARLLSLGAGELSLELRYQRGARTNLERAGPVEALSLLLGYSLRGDGDADTDTNTTITRQTLALKAGPMATRLVSPELGSSELSRYSDTYQPGFWLGAALTPTRLGSWLALMPQLEIAFVHHSARERASGPELPTPGQLALEYIDAAALVRAELAVGKTSTYALGGIYGSALIRAQHSSEAAITDMRAMVSRFDAGWIAGGGIERPLIGNTRVALEVRYQRGMRDLGAPSSAGDRAGATTQRSLTGLIGIVYGQSSGNRAAKRITAVAIGRPGDRWLSTIRFVRIERAKRDGEPGYRITYDVAGHGTVVLFWLRKDIDFEDKGRGYRHQHRPLKRGRLVYPTRLTRESLPRVYPYILEIEAAYAAQAQGGIAAMEGFAVVAALGEGTPTLRITRPRGVSGAGAGASAGSNTARRTATAKSAASLTKPSARALARALVAAGHTRPRGAAAHHIVAGSAKRAQRARRILKKFGIGINDAVNGVFLPATRKAPNPTGAAVHSTLHTKKYFDLVNDSLADLRTRAEVEAMLQNIGRMLLSGGF